MSDYQTPHKDGEVDKSLDEEDDLDDRKTLLPLPGFFKLKLKPLFYFATWLF